MLWDNAFVYERHEAKAYSFAWNSSAVMTDDFEPQMHADNPNNAVFTGKPWPTPCPEQSGNVVRLLPSHPRLCFLEPAWRIA